MRYLKCSPSAAIVLGLALCGWTAPALAQTDPDFCNVQPCRNYIPGLTYSESFETAMRELYGAIPLIGGNPDTLDLDFDGMKDTAQARLFDRILKFSLTTPNRNCVYWAYAGNRLKAEALALAINAGWPAWLGTAPDLNNTKLFIAALTTMGNEEILNTIMGGLQLIIPSLPDLSLLEFDGSAEVYLHAKGDADTDGICNLGEYKAWVVNVPQDLDIFVAAATSASITDYYGGCPACGDEGEGSPEGEGQSGCNLRADENYYAMMVLFGDTNDDGYLSKNELKAYATGWLLDLGWGLVDKDGDGVMSVAEFSGSNRLAGLVPEHLDADGDNQVTLAEIRQLSGSISQTAFDEADLNDNGVLDCEDLLGAGPEGSCYANWCMAQCPATATAAGFEASLRSLFGIASFLGVDPDTADVDSNGMYDLAQARLLDYILAHPDQNAFCCVRAAYMNNRVVAEQKLAAVPLIGSLLPSLASSFIPVVAGVLTQGEQSTIDAIVNIIDALIFWDTFELTGYDLSAGQYLASNGDPDFDAVCNIGEYRAALGDPADFDAFVAAALDASQTGDGGGCPPCGEGEGSLEGEPEGEGAPEGQPEGEGAPEGEGSVEGQPEGQIDCDIDGAESYYKLLVAFGDTNGNGTLSKAEVKAITGLSDFALLLWGLIDTNGDGELTLAEFLATSSLFDLLDGLDDNEDDQLTLAEVRSLNSGISQAQFDAVDENHNGVIDCQDLYGVTPEGEGLPEGQPEGEGAVEGLPEGQPEGEGAIEGQPEGEGAIEGQPEGEGTIEGQPEGEGAVEGEDCTLDDCPAFDAEGTLFCAKLSQELGSAFDWNTCDLDQSAIPDNWEVALLEAVICLGASGFDDAPICVFNDNVDTFSAEPSFPVFANFSNVLCGMMTISTEGKTAIGNFYLNGAYEVFTLAGGAEPFAADGDPDSDGLTNLAEYQNILLAGLGRAEYVIAALTPNVIEEGEGIVEGQPEGVVEGQPEGIVEGQPEGIVEGQPEGIVEGQPEGIVEGQPEGIVEGEPEGVVEGQPEGTADGEGEPPSLFHSADPNGDNEINLTELLRVIQFFNLRGFACGVGTEDGYAPGAGADRSCRPHCSDYLPQDWQISLTELLRLIQFFNVGAYHICPGQATEDGFCTGPAV